MVAEKTLGKVIPWIRRRADCTALLREPVVLGTRGSETKPDRKENRFCLCPGSATPPHIFIKFYPCICEEMTVGQPWNKGDPNVNSDTERLSSFPKVTQLI